MYADTTIRTGEMTPADVVLYEPSAAILAFPPATQETTVYLWANATEALAGADATDIIVTKGIPAPEIPTPTYPSSGHVRSPDLYGPTGLEYTGTETLPAASDVKLGVTYGASGAEFSGTLSGGGGSRIMIVGMM